MPRQRPPKGASTRSIPLQHPDRSKENISRETLFAIAEKRGLLNGQEAGSDDSFAGDSSNEVPIGRLGEAILWSISLAMLHFTFDVLVQHQYAVGISWWKIVTASLQAFGVFLVLCYTLHPHNSPSPLSPNLSPQYQTALSQLLFFVGSITCGCYMVYITNEHGYHAIMKRAPPVGCIWVWSVIELELKWALTSLICCGAFLWWGGYSYG